MTTPDHRLPKQTAEDPRFRELRQRVTHLADEVRHLTTVVEELRGAVGTAHPKERVVRSLARVGPTPSTEDVEIGLESFPQERCHTPPPGSGVKENHDDTPELAVGPSAEASPRWATAKTATLLGGAVGFTILLLVGLVRGDDRSDRISEGTPAVTPLVSQVLAVPPPPDEAAPVRAVSQAQNDERDHIVHDEGFPTESDPSPRLSVLRSAVGSDVIDRELVGRSDAFVVGTPVVFWTHVGGGRPDDAVRHVWSHDGREVRVTVLPVGSPSWRTQSRHTLLPESEGTWVVELQDSEGRVLVRHEFRCVGPDSAYGYGSGISETVPFRAATFDRGDRLR